MKSMAYNARTGWQQIVAVLALLCLTACSGTLTAVRAKEGSVRSVCDSYDRYDMCAMDAGGDGSIDVVYFQDSKQVFMYRDGMREAFVDTLSFHPCAMPLDEKLQAAGDRLLAENGLNYWEQLGVEHIMLTFYLTAKRDIDACIALHEEMQRGVLVQQGGVDMNLPRVD